MNTMKAVIEQKLESLEVDYQYVNRFVDSDRLFVKFLIDEYSQGYHSIIVSGLEEYGYEKVAFYIFPMDNSSIELIVAAKKR